MITTEEDAKKLWCPFSRVAFLGQHVGNRASTAMIEMAARQASQGDARDLDYYLTQRSDTNCIGSQCMAWHWVGTARNSQGHPFGITDEAHGRCGMVRP